MENTAYLSRWIVLQSCLHSMGTAAVMAGAGLLLSKKGLLNAAVSKGLARISLNLTIPCLLFSTIVYCPQVSAPVPETSRAISPVEAIHNIFYSKCLVVL